MDCGPGPSSPRAAPLGGTSCWGPLGLTFVLISVSVFPQGQEGVVWATGGNACVSEGMAGLAREGHGRSSLLLPHLCYRVLST